MKDFVKFFTKSYKFKRTIKYRIVFTITKTHHIIKILQRKMIKYKKKAVTISEYCKV